MWFHGTLGSGCTWSVVYWGIQLDIFLIGCGFFSALFVCYLMSCRSYVIPWNFGSGCTWSVVYWGIQLDVFLIGCGFFLALFVCRLMSCRSYVIPRNFGLRLYLICCLLRYTAGHLLDWLQLLFGLVCLSSHELSIVCDSMELWAQVVRDLLSTEVYSWTSSWLALSSFWPCLSAISWAVDSMWFQGTSGSGCTWSVVYWGIQLEIFLIGCGFFSALFVCRLMSCRSYVIPRNFGLRLYMICCLLRYTAGHLLNWLWLLFGLVCLPSHELSIVCDSMELWAQVVLDLLSTEVCSWISSWLAVASFWPCLSVISWAVDHMWFHETLASGCTWSVVYWGIQLDIFLIGCGSFSALFVCHLMSCRSYVIPWNFGLRLYLICCLCSWTSSWLAVASFRPCLSAVSWAVNRMLFHGTFGSGCTWSVVYWGILLDIFLIGCGFFLALFVCHLMSCR